MPLHKKLPTFVMEALIEDDLRSGKKKRWLEVLDFLFHTSGEYPMVEVWMPEHQLSRSYSLLNIHRFRIKE